MSILCYNCRGLGETLAVGNLRRIRRSRSPRVVFLSETKKLETEMRSMIKKFGEYGGVFVDCAGRSGGLACYDSHPSRCPCCPNPYIILTLLWSSGKGWKRGGSLEFMAGQRGG